MLYEDGDSAWTGGLTKQLYNKLNGRQKSLPGPDYVAMGSQERYYVRFKDGSSQWVGCEEMTKSLKKTEKKVKSIAFGKDWDSFFIVFTDGWYTGRNVPKGLSDVLKERDRKPDLECVSLGPKGEYYISVQSSQAWWGGTTQDNLDRIRKVRNRVMFIDFANDDTFLCRYTWSRSRWTHKCSDQ